MHLNARTVSRSALAIFFVVAGTAHFVRSEPYLAIMPPWIPWAVTLVAVSGAAEIIGGLGVCFRATRTAAAWGLIALLVAVFPANIYAISTGMVIGGHSVPAWMLWTRLPFQLLFIAWVYQVCLRRDALPR
ncbi:MAG: DoxX family membrane protein [Chthoniobacterales bacterium]|nr:DoxX family membrane protein [Chthoniobacterales bacterium]